MKRFFNWQILLALILVLLSVLFYFLHYLIFRDLHHIFIYLIGDIAFLFVDVLIVMLVLHRLLVYREKQSILKKLNMVIGTFFSEVGTELLKKFSRFDPQSADIGRQLVITKDWADKDFMKIARSIHTRQSDIDSKKEPLDDARDFLVSKRPFLLALLENPNLLEHESFTDLLWAVFHLTDELAHRTDLKTLPDSDYEHLAGDMKRAYHKLLVQWLDYMKHLKHDYPYLFSLAMRTNPFDENASVEVK
jgi:hypothetical protein